MSTAHPMCWALNTPTVFQTHASATFVQPGTSPLFSAVHILSFLGSPQPWESKWLHVAGLKCVREAVEGQRLQRWVGVKLWRSWWAKLRALNLILRAMGSHWKGRRSRVNSQICCRRLTLTSVWRMDWKTWGPVRRLMHQRVGPLHSQPLYPEKNRFSMDHMWSDSQRELAMRLLRAVSVPSRLSSLKPSTGVTGEGLWWSQLMQPKALPTWKGPPGGMHGSTLLFCSTEKWGRMRSNVGHEGCSLHPSSPCMWIAWKSC